MTQKTSSGAQTSAETQRNLMIRLIRISGGVFIVAGLMVFADIGGLGGLFGTTGNGTHKIIGGTFMFVGLIDIILVPRILEQIKKK